jgi:hypothetical protein
MNDDQQQVVRITSDGGQGDTGAALRRLRAALPEATVDDADEHGVAVVRLHAATREAAVRRIGDILASGTQHDPLRVAGPAVGNDDRP